MQLILNENPLELTDNVNIHGLFDHLDMSPSGFAIARNGAVVPQSDWGSTQLQDGDEVYLFRAIAGG